MARRLLGATLDAVERAGRTVSDCARAMESVTRQLGDLRQVVQQAADRADPAKLAARLPTATRADADADVSAVADAVSAFANEQRTRRPPQVCSLAVLYKHLAGDYPNLTIGQMHDALRRAASDKRIRLLPFTQALYQLSEPEYALVLGREVMFYVEAV